MKGAGALTERKWRLARKETRGSLQRGLLYLEQAHPWNTFIPWTNPNANTWSMAIRDEELRVFAQKFRMSKRVYCMHPAPSVTAPNISNTNRRGSTLYSMFSHILNSGLMFLHFSSRIVPNVCICLGRGGFFTPNPPFRGLRKTYCLIRWRGGRGRRRCFGKACQVCTWRNSWTTNVHCSVLQVVRAVFHCRVYENFQVRFSFWRKTVYFWKRLGVSDDICTVCRWDWSFQRDRFRWVTLTEHLLC